MTHLHPTSTISHAHQIVRLRWLTIAAWLYWLLVYWSGGGRRGLANLPKAWEREDSPLDLAAMTGIMVFSVPVIGSVFYLGTRRNPPVSPTLGRVGTLIGMLLTSGGVAGMSISRAYLGRFWTIDANVNREHAIIDHGPYGWVRHPIYTSAFAIYTGTAMVFPARHVVLLSALVCLAYAIKAQAEEHLLLQHLPTYTDYQKKVPSRILPGLW